MKSKKDVKCEGGGRVGIGDIERDDVKAGMKIGTTRRPTDPKNKKECAKDAWSRQGYKPKK